MRSPALEKMVPDPTMLIVKQEPGESSTSYHMFPEFVAVYRVVFPTEIVNCAASRKK